MQGTHGPQVIGKVGALALRSHAVVLAICAAVPALVLATWALGVVGGMLFALPAVVTWYTLQRSAAESDVRAHNAELESLNDALRHANDRLEVSLTTTLAVVVAERLGRPEGEIAAVFEQAVKALQRRAS